MIRGPHQPVDDDPSFVSTTNGSSDVIETDNSPAACYLMRGNTYEEKGDLDAAIADYSECIRLRPQQASSFAIRGSAWHDKGNFDLAIADLDEAIRLDPKFALAHHYRGQTRVMQRNYSGATQDFSRSLQLAPDNEKACREYARLLATCPLSEFRNGPNSVELATHACTVSNWKSPKSLSVLAAAYAETGAWSDAVTRQKQALELTTDLKAKPIRQKCLELYEHQMPLRDGLNP